jgi:Uma2 family endonuclease
MLITNAVTKRWTRDEYYRLHESGFFGPEERVELIEGELVLMAPAGYEHTNPIRRGNMLLTGLYRDTHDVAVQCPLDLGQISEPQPDFALIARDTIPVKALPTTADLVIEVSYSSLAFDRKEKAALYAKAGIPEYWIIDVVGRKVEVYREPGPLADSPGSFAFASQQVFDPSQSVQPLKVPGPACPLAAFFDE